MKQLYAFLCSYIFVTWRDCFVGHPCPGDFCLERVPLSLTCSSIALLGTLPTDDSHLTNMFSQVYFSVVVCLRERLASPFC